MDGKHSDPDFTVTHEQKYDLKSGREHEKQKLDDDFVNNLDFHIAEVRKNTKRNKYTFLLKYIGGWIILVSVFKGLFYEFSWTFDLIGLVLFLFGFMIERYKTRRAESEIRAQANQQSEIVYGKEP
ncbi:hypothetical protein COV93_03800 [Candidatus Woesearchaeota archaeon CG11_big_fil_rev_8_21_14_0_20_43_8]|nr:MAG: hypothetical protein COV93_03800 [Candidatus Woesearchaeota archaeon CG11_big_fil_rev_8_21_14_0_20_43_8]PIO04978.1 MAG: hypothetical protein COT47_06710 [Candidatus Woesearchaeota archaeon CG08_land_8_20_14_0_20_43_7]